MTRSDNAEAPADTQVFQRQDDLESHSRWHWYRSTWALTFGFILSLFLVIACGFPQEHTAEVNQLIEQFPPYSGHISTQSYLHGWPWPFLVRRGIDPGYPQDDNPPWLRMECWFGGPSAFYSYGAFFADFIVLLAATGLFALFLERRRRAGIRIRPFTLRKLLLVTTVFAICLSLWLQKHIERQRQFAFFEEKGAPTKAWRCCAPLLLQRICGKGLLPDFEVVEMVLVDDEESTEPKQLATCLKNAPQIKQFYAHLFNRRGMITNEVCRRSAGMHSFGVRSDIERRQRRRVAAISSRTSPVAANRPQ